MVEALRLPAHEFHPDALEYYGGLSSLKAAMVTADRITTVSPSYAAELMRPEFGMGLQGLIAARAADVVGILNGVDEGVWAPEAEPLPFGPRKMKGKAANRAALCAEFGLEVPGPLAVVVSRLTDQKGELMDTWTWFQSGINTDGAHNPVTTRKVQKGDILSLNCFSMISGYYTALERTLFLDHASDAHLRLWEINCKVHDEGKKLLKPGVKCSEVARELNKIFAEHDLLQYRTFGYGHSFGVLSHYYGR